MPRRPILLLSLVLAAAALLHAAFGPRSRSSDFDSNLPPGMACTTCGPIPTGVVSIAAQPSVALQPSVD